MNWMSFLVPCNSHRIDWYKNRRIFSVFLICWERKIWNLKWANSQLRSVNLCGVWTSTNVSKNAFRWILMASKSHTLRIQTWYDSKSDDEKTCDENSYEYTFQELVNLATIICFFPQCAHAHDERIFFHQVKPNHRMSHKC